MISVTQLWIPILLSAVLVFAASSLIHMVLKWHNSEYRKLADEDSVRAAIRASNPAPGQYLIPHCVGPDQMKDPAVQQKLKDGPNGFLTLRPPGMPSMGAPLIQWFVLSLVIALLAGYLASRTVPAGASAYAVWRVVGLTTFMAYATGGVTGAIWMGKPWTSALKEVLDAGIYAAVTSCAFVWLWPR